MVSGSSGASAVMSGVLGVFVVIGGSVANVGNVEGRGQSVGRLGKLEGSICFGSLFGGTSGGFGKVGKEACK